MFGGQQLVLYYELLKRS